MLGQGHGPRKASVGLPYFLRALDEYDPVSPWRIETVPFLSRSHETLPSRVFHPRELALQWMHTASRALEGVAKMNNRPLSIVQGPLV